MSPFEVSEAVLKVSDAVRRRFRRMGCPADPEDIAQEAAMHALEVVRGGKIKVGKNPRGYMYTAAVRETGLASSRWLAKVSISEHQAKNARRFQHAKTIEDAGVDEWPGGVVPEEVLDRLQEQAEHGRLRIRRARLLDGYAGSLGELDRKIVRMLFGLGDEAAPEGGIEEVAWRLGVDVAQVKRAISALRRAAEGDFGLTRIVRNIARMEDR